MSRVIFWCWMNTSIGGGARTKQDRYPTGRSLRKKVGYVAKVKDFDWLERPDVKADFEKYGAQIISLLDE